MFQIARVVVNHIDKDDFLLFCLSHRFSADPLVQRPEDWPPWLWGSVTSPGCQAAAVSIQAFLIMPRSFAATPGLCAGLPVRALCHPPSAALSTSIRLRLINFVEIFRSGHRLCRQGAGSVDADRAILTCTQLTQQSAAVSPRCRGASISPDTPDTAFPLWIVTRPENDWD